MKNGQAEQEFRALLTAAVDAIVIIDHRGVIRTFNRAAEELFGYAASEAEGANVSMLMPEPYRSEHDGYMLRYLESGEAHIVGIGREVDARRKDGTIFRAWLSVGRVEGEDPPRFVGFLHDVTAHQRAEEYERRAAERLAEVARLGAMASMAASIAHEVNQPLAAISTYALACERLLGLPNADLAEVRRALRQIAEQALRAGDSIRNMRELVRKGVGPGVPAGDGLGNPPP
ncbi:MAG: PAS domain S-box protein [Steroidobacteraceae bacterium]|nr:PAS domain S-box protein [Steroidobacteraceae bacterium]